MKRFLAIFICWMLLYGQCWAAISLRDATTIEVVDNDDTSHTFSIDTVAGDLLIVPTCLYDGVLGEAYPVVVSDDQGTLIWAQVDRGDVNNEGHTGGALAWTYNAAFTGTLNITVTSPASTVNYWGTGAAAFTGIDSSTPQDESGFAEGTNTTTDASVSTAGATDTVDELVAALACIELADADVALSVSTAGFINIFNEQDGSNHVPTSFDYKVISGTGVETVNWSHDPVNCGAACTWDAVALTFRAAATPPSGGTRRRMNTQGIVVQ